MLFIVSLSADQMFGCSLSLLAGTGSSQGTEDEFGCAFYALNCIIYVAVNLLQS